MDDSKKRLDRLNLVLMTIRNVNRLIARERNRAKLLQGICDNLTENRGYYNAWISIFDSPGQPAEFAETGLGESFLPMIQRIENGRLTQCAEEAIKHSEVVIRSNPVAICKDCPLSVNYMGRGAMTTRLAHREKIYGIICVSIPRKLVRDKEEQGLFKEIAEDIALGIYKIEIGEERERFANEIQGRDRQFRNLVENCLVGISIIQNNEVVYQNPEQERLLGPLPRKFKLIDFESIHPNDIEKVREFNKQITSGKIQTLDTDFRFFSSGKTHTKSDMKWVICRVTSIEYQGREAVMLNMIDITQTKELEHIIRIQEKMGSLGRVAAGIAHEIRNPLSGINIYLNTLKKIYNRAGDIDNVPRIIEQIQSASKKIESVVKRVMDFSRPSEPKFFLADVNQPINEAIKLSSVTLRKRGIKLESRLANTLPSCYIDPTMIEEVTLNLITNAVEAMQNIEEEKRMEVVTSIENNHIVLRVSDSGPGVPQRVKDRIFDPFYSTKNGSTGIGLSLVQRIVTDHNGSLDILKSKLGGAEFKIKIPIEKGSGKK